MEIADAGDSLRRNERRIAGKDQHVIVVLESFTRGHDGMTGATLLRLQYKLHPGISHGLADMVSLMTDDGVDVFRWNNLARRFDYVCQQGFAADLM